MIYYQCNANKFEGKSWLIGTIFVAIHQNSVKIPLIKAKYSNLDLVLCLKDEWSILCSWIMLVYDVNVCDMMSDMYGSYSYTGGVDISTVFTGLSTSNSLLLEVLLVLAVDSWGEELPVVGRVHWVQHLLIYIIIKHHMPVAHPLNNNKIHKSCN